MSCYTWLPLTFVMWHPWCHVLARLNLVKQPLEEHCSTESVFFIRCICRRHHTLMDKRRRGGSARDRQMAIGQTILHDKDWQMRTASCHVGQTGTHLITKVKLHWPKLVLGWMTSQITSIPGAVRRCSRILRPGPGPHRKENRIPKDFVSLSHGMLFLRKYALSRVSTVVQIHRAARRFPLLNVTSSSPSGLD
jgi:hypothetical protein